MSEAPKIMGGHNQLDPLRDRFELDLLPTAQIPEVQTRCLEVWGAAFRACINLQNGRTDLNTNEYYQVRTHTFSYEGEVRRTDLAAAPLGEIALSAHVPILPDGWINFPAVSVRLKYKTKGWDTPQTTLFEITKDEIWVHTEAGKKAGNQSDLNYFWNVVDKIAKTKLADPAST